VTGPAPYSSPVEGRAPPSNGGTSLVEAVGVWGLWALAAIAVIVTYSRISAQELYNVSGGGLEGGAGRALVFLGYPVAFVALAVLVIVFGRLVGGVERAAAVVAAALCATVVIPGVVDQGDLDARPINALAAVGVGVAAVLTGIGVARGGLGEPLPFGRADVVRLTVAAVLLVAALPWLFAELGFYLDGIPVLDPIFMSEELYTDNDHAAAAVHLGDHHGTDGVLLAWTALALSRTVPTMREGFRRTVLVVYLCLMLVYGLALALEDFWLEQLVKRDVTSVRLPNMIRPDLSPAWGAIVAVTAVLAVLALRYGTHPGHVRTDAGSRRLRW
jgi:hypothetical protein